MLTIIIFGYVSIAEKITYLKAYDECRNDRFVSLTKSSYNCYRTLHNIGD